MKPKLKISIAMNFLNFRKNSNKLLGVTKNIFEIVLKGNFLKELCLDIQVKICARTPNNLEDIMLTA